jgi:hypothetical protein
MYLIRQIWNCARGKGSDFVEDVKALNNNFASMGNASGKVYVDYAGRMDTVVWQIEVESLDQFFTNQRGFYANIDADGTKVISRMNTNTVEGNREIWEVIA